MLTERNHQQVTSQSVGYADHSKPQVAKTTRIGIAVGGGWIKATNGQQVVKARSLVLESEPPDFFGINSQNWCIELLNSAVAGKFVYIGDKVDGDPATKSLANGEKGNLYPVSALAAIAQLLPKNTPHKIYDVEIACSIPTQRMKGDLTLIKGHHLIKNGTKSGNNVQINITRVVAHPEGLGTCVAIANSMKSQSVAAASFAVMDSGFANTTITGLDAENTLLGFKSLTPGVAKLYETIAGRLNRNGHPATIEEVRLGAETFVDNQATFELRGHGGTNFEALYYEELERWFDARISAIQTGAQSILDRAQYKYVAGGGSQLPGVKELAKAGGYGIVSDPQEKEVHGLWLLAH